MKETDHILTCDHLLLVFSLWEYLDRPQKGPGKVASVCPGRVGVLAVPFIPVSPAVSTRHSTNKHVLSEKANQDQLSLPGAPGSLCVLLSREPVAHRGAFAGRRRKDLPHCQDCRGHRVIGHPGPSQGHFSETDMGSQNPTWAHMGNCQLHLLQRKREITRIYLHVRARSHSSPGVKDEQTGAQRG